MNATTQVKLASLTAQTVRDLLPKLDKGQFIVYHVGSLMYDRLRGPTFLTTHGAAMAAYDAYQRGEVTLVQRKLAPLKYEYIAIRR